MCSQAYHICRSKGAGGVRPFDETSASQPRAASLVRSRAAFHVYLFYIMSAAFLVGLYVGCSIAQTAFSIGRLASSSAIKHATFVQLLILLLPLTVSWSVSTLSREADLGSLGREPAPSV